MTRKKIGTVERGVRRTFYLTHVIGLSELVCSLIKNAHSVKADCLAQLITDEFKKNKMLFLAK